MKTERPTDKQIWDAMDVLSRGISWIARDAVANDPRGATGDVMEANQAESARVASMDLSNTITQIFDKYRN